MASSPSSRPGLTGPLLFVVLGLATLVASFAISSGFFHGVFIGATIALMAFGAYLFGRAQRGGAATTDDTLWRPSDDQR